MSKHTNLYEEIENPTHRLREKRLWQFDKFMFGITIPLVGISIAIIIHSIIF